MYRFLSALLILHLLIFLNSATAQTPGGLNYQGVARNEYFVGLNKKPITLKFKIREKTVTGAVIYSETRVAETDSFGVFNVVIGSSGASEQSGPIKQVPWSDATKKFLQVELDIQDFPDLGFINMGTTELLSVPFSFYSDVSDSTRISDSTRAAGKADWAKIATNAESAAYANASGKYFFSATMDPLGSQTIMPSQEDPFENYVYDNRVNFPVVKYNEGSHYNAATSEFTAPENGIYQFDFLLNKQMLEQDGFSFSDLYMALKKNDKIAANWEVLAPGTTWVRNNECHVRLNLVAGDKISVNAANEDSNPIVISAAYVINGNLTYFNNKYEMTSFIEFSGYKIK